MFVYFFYFVCYFSLTDPTDFGRVSYNRSPDVIPEFTIEPEVALELLMASNYLDS
jgi:hypothetical protein